jgi:hypothetical protein
LFNLQNFGTPGLGVDIDESLVRLAGEKAIEEGVQALLEFR